jgi:hypothetical protein
MVPEMAVKKVLTSARLRFPILEQGSNIQRAFSVRLAILKRVLDSGLSGLMDVLSCRILGSLACLAAVFLDEPADVIVAFAGAFGAFDAEHVELITSLAAARRGAYGRPRLVRAQLKSFHHTQPAAGSGPASS